MAIPNACKDGPLLSIEKWWKFWGKLTDRLCECDFWLAWSWRDELPGWHTHNWDLICVWVCGASAGRVLWNTHLGQTPGSSAEVWVTLPADIPLQFCVLECVDSILRASWQFSKISCSLVWLWMGQWCKGKYEKWANTFRAIISGVGKNGEYGDFVKFQGRSRVVRS